MLVLASLLISAVTVAYYFYTSGEEIKKKSSELVTIFIAKDNIKKETLITKEHIKQTTIAKQYILSKPMIEKEIIGKFAKEPIYKNEMFLKEKLVPKLVKTNDQKVLDYKYNSYNMAFELFQNPNFALEPDDWVNIVSVYNSNMDPQKKDKNVGIFSVQYVAKHIKVMGFLRDGEPTMKSIIKKKVTTVVKKKKVTKIVTLKANELLLDIDQKVLLRLIDDYNKGKQLWMVKTKKPVIKKVEEPKVKEIQVVEGDKIKKVDLTKKAKKKYIKRSYPVKWYKTKDITMTKTAVIEYSDNPEATKTKTKRIRSNFVEECSQKDKLLIGLSSSFNIRSKPSKKAKRSSIGFRNYILPYRGISSQNSDWYELCDGRFVHKSVVKEIGFTEVLKKIEKQKKKKK